jgi:hypothetical protein
MCASGRRDVIAAAAADACGCGNAAQYPAPVPLAHERLRLLSAAAHSRTA